MIWLIGCAGALAVGILTWALMRVASEADRQSEEFARKLNEGK